MGALYVIKHTDQLDGRGLRSSLRESFARQGFGLPHVQQSRHWEVGLYGPLVAPTATTWCSSGDLSAACVGALIYRNAVGSNALAQVLADYLAGRLDWSALRGSFAVAIATTDRVVVFTDPMGTLHLFADRDWQMISTSFLAIAGALPRRRINEDALYDYVFNGAPHGGHTVFREIELCERRTVFELNDRVHCRPIELSRVGAARRETHEDHARRCLGVLRGRLMPVARAFRDRIDTALSGGYDSRLVLALLRGEGVSPRLHVYGADNSADVRIAKAIAAGEGFALECVNKAAVTPVPPDAFPAVVQRNLLAFDGYPADGLFDMGIDLATRQQRCADGEIMLNGGGGEVFRNFFYLPDRSLTLHDIVRSFYSRFDPRVCTSRFDERAYVTSYKAKLARALGTSAALPTRTEIEAIYPDFRCRFWTGRNNSVNNRLGLAVTPFIDPVIVDAALAVPVSDKNAGRLEARMIALADPRLASYPSVYGHPFDHPPPLRRRLADAATRLRPPFLRQFSYRLQHRRALTPPLALSRDYTARVIGTRFDYMKRFFTLGGVRDIDQYNRICTLEYLFQQLNAIEE